MISLKYTVYSAAIERVPVPAEVSGQTVTALVDRLVIELTDDAGEHGHTFRLPIVAGDRLAALSAAFPVGAPLTLTLTPGDPA